MWSSAKWLSSVCRYESIAWVWRYCIPLHSTLSPPASPSPLLWSLLCPLVTLRSFYFSVSFSSPSSSSSSLFGSFLCSEFSFRLLSHVLHFSSPPLYSLFSVSFVSTLSFSPLLSDLSLLLLLFFVLFLSHALSFILLFPLAPRLLFSFSNSLFSVSCVSIWTSLLFLSPHCSLSSVICLSFVSARAINTCE